MFSSLNLKLFIIICYEKKKNYFKKIKGLLYSLKKYAKVLPLKTLGDF